MVILYLVSDKECQTTHTLIISLLRIFYEFIDDEGTFIQFLPNITIKLRFLFI